MFISSIDKDLILINFTREELFNCSELKPMLVQPQQMFDRLINVIMNQIIEVIKEEITEAPFSNAGLTNYVAAAYGSPQKPNAAIMLASQKYKDFVQEILELDKGWSSSCLQDDFNYGDYSDSLTKAQVLVIANLIENKIETSFDEILHNGIINYFRRSEDINANLDAKENLEINAALKSESAEMQHKNKVNSKQQKKTKILDLSKLDVQQYLKPSASVMSVVNNENVDSRVTNFKLGIRFESWDVASAIIKVINTKGKSEIYQYKGGKVLILTFPDMSLIEALQICNTLIEYDNSKWLNSCQISKVGEYGKVILDHCAAQEMSLFI